MKKIFVLLITSMFVVSAAHAISVTEYIEKNGPITIENGVVDLKNQDLTNLNGLELIVEPEKVTVLDLSNNQLIAVGATQLNMFPNLEQLNLSNNQLTAIPPLSLPNLKKLKLNKNNLTVLSDFNLPKLQKLNASDNPIHTLSNLGLPNLKKLKIIGSNWILKSR